MKREIPQQLELNLWLAYELSHGTEVSKLLCLSELLAGGVPGELAEAVSSVALTEGSQRCSEFATRLLELEEAKVKLVNAFSCFNLTPDAMGALLENAHPALISSVKQSLRKPPPGELISIWRERLVDEKSPGIIEAGLTLLARFGKAEDIQFALPVLMDENPGPVKAALDLLNVHGCEQLQSHLERALEHSSSEIKAHAAGILRKSDPRMAMYALEEMLSSRDPVTRQRALREVILVPFLYSEPAYMQFIGVETQPILLVAAGFGLVFNPHPELPLKLYDILLASSGTKKHILQLLTKQIIESIHAAGILKQDTKSYVESLKREVQNRRSKITITFAMNDLASPAEDVRLAAVEKLRPHIDSEAVRQAVEARLRLETSEDVRAALEILSGKGDEFSLSSLEQMIDSGEFLELDSKRQKGLLKVAQREKEFKKLRTRLRGLFHATSNRTLILELIHIFGRHGFVADSDLIVPLLDHPEKPVVAAAIRALGRLNIDAVLPRFNALLADDDPRVKTATLELFLLKDKEAAVGYIEALSRSPQSPMRQVALSLMPLVDYASIHPFAIRILRTDNFQDLRSQAAFLVASNPTHEGLVNLYLFFHNENGELKQDFQKLWRLATETASGFMGRTIEELEQICVEESANEVALARSELRSGRRSEAEATSKEALPAKPLPGSEKERIIKDLYELRFQFAIAAVILSPLLWFLVVHLFGSGRYPEGAVTCSRPKGSFFESARDLDGPTTQVGSSDWVGVLHSNARSVLSGSGYQKIMSEAQQQRKESEEAIAKEYLDYLTGLSRSQDEDAMIRMVAAAHLNPDLREGQQAMRDGDIFLAMGAMRRVLGDSGSNAVARTIAFQTLLEIAMIQGRDDDFAHLLGQLMNEAGGLPDMEKIREIEGLRDLGSIFEKITRISRMTREESTMETLRQSFDDAGDSSDEIVDNLQSLQDFSIEHDLNLNKL